MMNLLFFLDGFLLLFLHAFFLFHTFNFFFLLYLLAHF